MGANIIPIAKNRGSTVLGVKIGLRVSVLVRPGDPEMAGSRGTHCHAFNRCCRNAVSEQFKSHQHLFLPSRIL